MTLKEYLNELNKLLEKNPQAGDFLVIHSSDDEGNSYQPVYFAPCLMRAENPEHSYLEITEGEPNMVCIN
ncbi:MAG: hypothetical protein RLZZ196_2238 [Bacteroidota bacterium]|jgi:hypothetical protein